MIRVILERALGRRYDVTAVEGPGEALDALACRPYTLMLTDINMPGGSGITLAATVRELAPETRVAFLAAVVDEATHDRIEEMGATLFVKPFDLVDLVAMVDTLLTDR
jgi:DNA-binding response OmpR family regulator